AHSASFTFTNRCPYTVWPGILSGGGSSPSATGYELGSGVSSAARAKLDFKLVRVSWYQSDLVESDLVAMAEGPNATDPAQVLAQQVGGPSINPRPLNTRTRLDQLEDKMLALSGIIDQVTTLEERLDGFSDDQAHMGERLVTLEGVVEGNMATLLDQVAELSSKSSSQSQQRAGSSNNYNKGKNGGYQARSGGDQGHGQNRSGGASAGGASSSNSGREYHRPRNNGGASSSSRFQGRPGNLKCFLCGGNHKAYQCVSSAARAKLDFKLVRVSGDGGNDFYDISLVDGFNLPISITPTSGCPVTSCPTNVNSVCPSELSIKNGGKTIACKSACLAFNSPQYCCTGANNQPSTCPPTDYSRVFKNACPRTYSYAYDDQSSTFTCGTGADYTITFCP
ncbi:hypothetical protein GIB67_017223, partial [Kingdonia uniflora]